MLYPKYYFSNVIIPHSEFVLTWLHIDFHKHVNNKEASVTVLYLVCNMQDYASGNKYPDFIANILKNEYVGLLFVFLQDVIVYTLFQNPP